MTRGRTDGCHASVGQALRAIGLHPMDLSQAGNGVEDYLVPLQRRLVNCHLQRFWLLVECKVPRNQRAEVTPSQYTKAQREWRKLTEGWPRIVVTSGQDAVDQIRGMTG